MQTHKTPSIILFLLVVTILFSLGGIVLNYSLLSSLHSPPVYFTGRVTDSSSTVTLTQSGTAGITLTDSAIAFGSGYYNSSCILGISTLESNHTFGGLGPDDPRAAPACWINTSATLPATDFHIIQNNGSVKVNISAYSNQQDAETLFCGAAGPTGCPLSVLSAVHLMSTNDEGSSCGAGLTSGFLSGLLLTQSSNFTVGLCNSLDFQDSSDTIDVYVKVLVPRDATSGTKTLTIMYQALAI